MLTQNQQDLVCRHVGLVDTVIHFKIRRDLNNPDYCYDDLYQCGCIGLCKAAARHDPKGGAASFETYAKRAIHNEIVDYCRSINRHGRVDCLDNTPPVADAQAEDFVRQAEADVDLQRTLEQLRLAKARYTGTALKGVISMELKLMGLSGSEIAALYRVRPNHVSAWIARARSKLRADGEFAALVS